MSSHEPRHGGVPLRPRYICRQEMQVKQRVLTAAVLIPVVVLAAANLHLYGFTVFTGIFVCLGAWEWAAMSGYENPILKFIYVLLSLMFAAGCLYRWDTVIPPLVVIIGAVWWLVPAVFLLYGSRRGPVQPPVEGGNGPRGPDTGMAQPDPAP